MKENISFWISLVAGIVGITFMSILVFLAKYNWHKNGKKVTQEVIIPLRGAIIAIYLTIASICLINYYNSKVSWSVIIIIIIAIIAYADRYLANIQEKLESD